MNRDEKKVQNRFRTDLYEQASWSVKYKNVKQCINLFNVLGIRYSDMSCNFSTNNIIGQDFFDIVCFYKGLEHNWENISIILDLDLDYENKQQITHYSYYMFSILPNLSFIIFVYGNEPYYVFKKMINSKLNICLSSKLMNFDK